MFLLSLSFGGFTPPLGGLTEHCDSVYVTRLKFKQISLSRKHLRINRHPKWENFGIYCLELHAFLWILLSCTPVHKPFIFLAAIWIRFSLKVQKKKIIYYKRLNFAVIIPGIGKLKTTYSFINSNFYSEMIWN